MASEYILQTNGLTKEFKGFTAVNKVNLRVRRGTIAKPCFVARTSARGRSTLRSRPTSTRKRAR